jgi:hypothetical protein
MAKRWLISVVLFVTLVVLMFVYVVATSRLAGSSVYVADQRQALVVHERMNLSQSAPISNFYVEGKAGELEAIQADQSYGAAATMGAAECRVRATLDARYEEVEGVTTTVYDLEFEGTYLLRYEGSVPTTTLELVFPFPNGLDTLNQVYFLVDGKEPGDVRYSLDNITWWTELASGEEREVTVRYQARGVGSFTYALDHNRRLEDLDVEIAVHGLDDSEVPDDYLPTTSVDDVESVTGERFAWRYEALIADRDVRVVLPARSGFVQRVEKLQEPLGALSRFSPLLVAFFVACLAGVHRLDGVRLPIEHYLLAGLGFFLFYPALVFLSGVFELGLAAAVALPVITALLVIFVGRATASRRAAWQMALLCGVFFGLFSLGMMSRLRGLLFTAGGLLLVGVFMVLLARRRPVQAPPRPGPLPEKPPEPLAPHSTEPESGSDRDSGHEATEPREGEPETEDPACVELTANPDDGLESEPPVAEPPPLKRYCPHCGTGLDDAFSFCPGCGRDAKLFRCCPACGAEHYVPAEAELAHCPLCGEEMGA